MARRRYQRGSVFLRGTREQLWIGRFREDVLVDGKLRRVSKSEVLGTKRALPTKRLAMRELEKRLATINGTSYRARIDATFETFSKVWREKVLLNKKPSTVAVMNSQLRTWLIPFFGETHMRDISTIAVQGFVNSCDRSPKTKHNLILTLRLMWKFARAWGYVDRSADPFEGLDLPKNQEQQRMFFTVAEIQKILSKAGEPEKTFYWLAVEGGLRAGELVGLRVEDLDLEGNTISVRQSIWRNIIQTPKSAAGVRQFAISDKLAGHLRLYLTTWRPNNLGLLFATKTGRPWAPCNLLRSKLHPLLDSLGIRRCGLHAFRHSNASLLDRLSAPMKTRQERLGHAAGSEITLKSYTHSVCEDDRRVATQLGDLLCPSCAQVSKQGESRDDVSPMIQ
jgi:integrase